MIPQPAKESGSESVVGGVIPTPPRSKLPRKNLFLIILASTTFILIFSVVLLQIAQKPKEKVEEFEADTYSVVEEADEELVPNFPDIPQYSNIESLQSKSYTEEGGIGYSSDYQTTDSLSTVFNWFRDSLPKDGWEIGYYTKFEGEPDSFLLEATKEDVVLSITGAKLEEGNSRIITTHHENMGEFGPIEKYE